MPSFAPGRSPQANLMRLNKSQIAAKKTKLPCWQASTETEGELMREQRAQDREKDQQYCRARTRKGRQRRGRKWRATFYLADPVQEQDISAVIWRVCPAPATRTHREIHTESQSKRARAAVYAE